MYKVLVCGLTANLGGIEKVVLNFYKNIDRSKVQFDFICLGEEKIGFSEEIEKLVGNKVKYYYLPKRAGNPYEFRKKLEKLFKTHAAEYDAVWVNICMLTNIEYLKLAKKYGIKRRIVHSHSSSAAKKDIRNFLHLINRYKIHRYATDFWACSDEAARWFYPKKIMPRYLLVRNAIDISDFFHNEEKRRVLRTELGVKEDEIIIGHVGRINFPKNHEFILDIFSEVVKKESNAKLALVGGGDNNELKKQAQELGVLDKVLFLGMRDDVADLYNIFDFLLFPSRFEGLPVVLLEAQANGLPILASDVITEQVKVNNNVQYLSLTESKEKWAEEIIASLKKNSRVAKDKVENNFSNKGFVIEEEAKRIEEILLK